VLQGFLPLGLSQAALMFLVPESGMVAQDRTWSRSPLPSILTRAWASIEVCVFGRASRLHLVGLNLATSGFERRSMNR
jgi:hypothetical protein